MEGEPKPGARIKGRILDVNKKDGIVDLTLKAALVAAGPKKASQPEVTSGLCLSDDMTLTLLVVSVCPAVTVWLSSAMRSAVKSTLVPLRRCVVKGVIWWYKCAEDGVGVGLMMQLRIPTC